IGGPGRVATIQCSDPLAPISPTTRVVSGQSRWRRAVLIHPSESLRHPDDRSVLCLEFLQMALSALDNENRLSQIRRVDDCKLRAGWRRRQDENDRSY